VRRTGLMEPPRLHGPTGPEPADEPLHAAGARCCAPGAAWCAPDPELAAGRSEAPDGQGTGHGTAGRPTVSRRAAARGWRMAGRGLITGGLMLCGWLAASAGHAYASQITAPSAPHGHQADLVTIVTTAGHEAAQSVLRPAVHLTGAQRPASTLLAAPNFPGAAGAGAGNQDGAATAPVTALASRVPGVTASVTSGLRTAITGRGPGRVARSIGSVTSPVLRLPRRGAARRISGFSSITVTGHRSATVTVSRLVVITPGTSRVTTPSRTSRHQQSAHVAGPAWPGSGHLARGVAHAGPAAVRSLHQGRHHRHGESASARHHRRPAPSDRLAPGTATQTDPASSGGGAGAAQAVAQGPPHAGSRNPTGRLVRRSVSRWPAGRLGATDPAVSPD
jgi:hypothetical protein